MNIHIYLFELTDLDEIKYMELVSYYHK